MGRNKLKAAFAKVDTNCDGKIGFEDFLLLLRKGRPNFSEEQAEALFHVVDKDLSGEIDFHEFVDFLYDHKSMEDFISPTEDDQTEEEAKAIVLGKPLKIRSAASRGVKQRGGKWSGLTWKERLEEVVFVEGTMPPGMLSPQPSVEPNLPTTWTRAEEPAAEDRPPAAFSGFGGGLGGLMGGGGGMDLFSAAGMMQSAASDGDERRDSKTSQGTGSLGLLAAAEGIKSSGGGHAMASMSQSELVEYSLMQEDLCWAGEDYDVLSEMKAFKEHLITAGGPFDAIELERYVAKGTAGWVFKVNRKSTGETVALKLIRMTQVRTGMKEWYVSKLMREEGLANIVFTDEECYVLEKAAAPDMIQEELKEAGPVPYYVCFVQEFVDGGTLEGLAQDGKLTAPMLLEAMKGVASSVAKLHARNIAHRDMKPENLLVKMRGDELVAAKLCDFGRAEIGDNPAARADDVRRFGVTLFSLATGEGWTANRLIHEEHGALVARLRDAVQDSGVSSLQALPGVLEKILDGGLEMKEVLALLQEL